MRKGLKGLKAYRPKGTKGRTFIKLLKANISKGNPNTGSWDNGPKSMCRSIKCIKA